MYYNIIHLVKSLWESSSSSLWLWNLKSQDQKKSPNYYLIGVLWLKNFSSYIIAESCLFCLHSLVLVLLDHTRPNLIPLPHDSPSKSWKQWWASLHFSSFSILSYMVCYQDSFPYDHAHLCVPLFAYHPVKVWRPELNKLQVSTGSHSIFIAMKPHKYLCLLSIPLQCEPSSLLKLF